MQFLTKESLTNLPPVKIERVEIPELDSFCFVREMSSAQKDAFEDSTMFIDGKGQVQKRMENYRAKFLVQTICDEQGNLVFTMGDLPALGQLPASVAVKMFSAAQRINGMTVEEAEKNSGSDQDASSSSN